MKLFYHQPDGHGPISFFVMAASAQAAATRVNLYVETEIETRAEKRSHLYEAPDYPFTAADFQEASEGEVITNDND